MSQERLVNLAVISTAQEVSLDEIIDEFAAEDNMRLV